MLSKEQEIVDMWIFHCCQNNMKLCVIFRFDCNMEEAVML